MALAQLSTGFQSLPPLPTSKLDLFGADSHMCGFVYVLGPCGSLQRTLLCVWEFLPLPRQPPQVFSISGLMLYFPSLESCVARSVLLPLCSSRFICAPMWGRPLHLLLPHQSSSHRLASSPLCPAAHLRPSYWSG